MCMGVCGGGGACIGGGGGVACVHAWGEVFDVCDCLAYIMCVLQ